MSAPRKTPEGLGLETQAPLLYLTVDIGGGKQDAIVIYPDDKPAALASDFCYQKRLPAETRAKLEALIAQSKEAAFRYRATRSLDYRPPVQPLGTRPSVAADTSRPQQSRCTRYSVTELASTHSDSKPRNYGEWLYHRDQITKRRKLVEAIRARSTRSEEPQARKPRKASLDPKEDDLIGKGKETQRRIRRMRKAALEEEKHKCPFRPTLNPRSKVMDRSSSESRFDKLFSDASSLCSRQVARASAFLTESCPFRPFDSLTKPSKQSQLAMVDRLINSKREFESAVSKLREELETSSVPSFRPLTGRAPNSRSGPVHDQLYGQRTHKEAKLRELAQEYNRHTRSQHVEPTTNSRRIVADYRRRQIERLFERVDTDGDRLVSVKGTEELSGVDARTVKLLGTVWKELVDTGKAVGLREFTTLVDNALKSMSQEEKSYLLKHCGELSTQSSPHSLSSSLLTPHHTSQRSIDIYTRSVTSRSQSTDKLRKMKEEMEAKSLAECTFRPKLTIYRRPTTPTALY